MKFRTAYLGILGIVLVTYGVILNMLGAMASFLHPGPYHSGALGTPMWCGLCFIIFGSVNLVKAVEKTEEKKARRSFRLPIVLPLTNLLSVFTSLICIGLTTWGMATNDVSLLTTNKVVELLVAVQPNASGTSAPTNNIQLSLVPLYSTVVAASSIICILSLVGMCIDCVNVSYAGPRRDNRKAASPDLGPWGWEDREYHGQAQHPYGDAVGEVMYGNTPPLKALTFDKYYHDGGDDIKEEPAGHMNGGIPRAKHDGEKSHFHNHHHHQDQVYRHLKRSDNRPKPYFYL